MSSKGDQAKSRPVPPRCACGGLPGGLDLTTEAELRRFSPWGGQAPSLLLRSEQNKRVGMVTVSALGYYVSGSPPSGWSWGLISLAPLELRPLALARNDATISHGHWTEGGLQDFSALLLYQDRTHWKNFLFIFVFLLFFLGGGVVYFSSVTLFIYFVCLYMQSMRRTTHRVNSLL